MHIKVEKIDNLHRKLDVQIPASVVQQQYLARLQQVAKQAKVDGFRPGKVPVKVVETRFGNSVLHEVCGDLMRSNLEQAIREEKLQVAGMPKVEPKEIKKDHPLEFTATFEVFPDIQLKDLSGQTLELQTAEITDKEIEAMLTKLRQQHAEFKPIERAAEHGDTLTIDFVGTIEGEKFQGGEAHDFKVNIGSHSLITGFEEGLEGLKAGDSKVLKLEFPKEYHAKNLAGKPVDFEVTVKAVAAPELPEVNDAFVKRLGVEGNVATLQEEIRKRLATELKAALWMDTKNRVLDQLLSLNPLELPHSAVHQEIEHLQHETRHRIQQQLGMKDLPAINLDHDLYEDQAHRRVSVGLLLAEVIKRQGIQVEEAAVRAKIEELAQHYQKPEEVVNWYLQNREMRSEIESSVLEEAAIKALLKDANVTEKKVSAEAILNPQPSEKKGVEHDDHIHG
ncbi:MAG TPA: trigger factor [Coxiellaceae bacterium]|nr:trigger factor [Coxiellaceae bacterium]